MILFTLHLCVLPLIDGALNLSGALATDLPGDCNKILSPADLRTKLRSSTSTDESERAILVTDLLQPLSGKIDLLSAYVSLEQNVALLALETKDSKSRSCIISLVNKIVDSMKVQRKSLLLETSQPFLNILQSETEKEIDCATEVGYFALKPPQLGGLKRAKGNKLNFEVYKEVIALRLELVENWSEQDSEVKTFLASQYGFTALLEELFTQADSNAHMTAITLNVIDGELSWLTFLQNLLKACEENKSVASTGFKAMSDYNNR